MKLLLNISIFALFQVLVQSSLGGVGSKLANESDVEWQGDSFYTHELLIKFFGAKNAKLLHYIKEADRVQVNVSLTLVRIINLDTVSQVMTAVVWVSSYWYSDIVLWNPADYGGVRYIVVPSYNIWIPDIYVWNNIDDEYRQILEQDVATITYNGRISYLRPSLYRVYCKPFAFLYPFDTHDCSFIMGSWTYTAEEVDVHLTEHNSADTSRYQQSTIWKLLDFESERKIVNYHESLDGSHPDVSIVEFTVHMIRRYQLTFIYVCVPSIILNIISLLAHFVPPEATEKISLCGSIIFAVIIYLVLLHGLLPISDSIPFIVRYLLCIMAMVTIGMLMSIVVLNIHFRGSQRRPKAVSWLVRKIFLNGLAKMVFLADSIVPDDEHLRRITAVVSDLNVAPESSDFTDKDASPEDDSKESFQEEEPASNKIKSAGNKLSKLVKSRSKSDGEVSVVGNDQSVYTHSVLQKNKELPVYKTLKYMEYMSVKDAEERYTNEIMLEWQQVAMVLDRAYCAVYLIVSLSFLLEVIIRAYF